MFASLLNGRAFVLCGLVYVQALMLLRSVLVARLLGPEQFGIAMTFLLIQQFIDMSTDTGLNKYLLQSREGNRSVVQGTVQVVALVRGVTAAVLIISLGFPILLAIGFAGSILPFLVLGASALALGIVHFDNARLQRREIFLNESLSNMFGETCALVIALVALFFIRDYTVMLYALLARSVGMVTASHFLSKRRYTLLYNRGAAKPMWLYIRPLLVNGPLLFVSAQADRLLVSTVLGPLELGIYSAALLLVWTPSGLFTRFLGTTFLPRLAAEHRAGESFSVERAFRLTILLGFIAIAAGFTAIGGFMVRILYGEAYISDVLVISLIGCTQAVRFMRTWPSGLALAGGHTGTLLSANFLRFAALPLGLIGLLVEQGLIGLVIGLLAGELLSLCAAILLFNRAAGRPTMSDYRILTVVTVLSIAVPLCVWAAGATLWGAFAAGSVTGLFFFSITFVRSFGRPSLRALVQWGQAR